MLRTSSGDRAAEAEEGSELLLAGAGVAAAAAVRAATIPGARFARGTLRGRPALVVWTEAAWSFAGASAATSAAASDVAAGWPAGARSALTRSAPARRLERPGGGGEAGASGSVPPGGVAGANGLAPPGGGPDAPGVLVGSGPVRARVPVPSPRDLPALAVGATGASGASAWAAAALAETG